MAGCQHPSKGRPLLSILLIAVIAGLVVLSTDAMTAQWLNQPTPGLPRTADGRPNLTAPAPRASDGRPDISGLWRRASTVFVSDLFRDLNITGAVMTPWAAAVYQQRDRRDHVDDPLGYCLPSAPPRLNATVHFKTVQTSALIAVLYETSSGSTFRQIFTDGRSLPTSDVEPTFLGYSVGRWDGDSLVVETTGFRDGGWLDIAGHPHSDALHVTERFRRINVGTMELTMTVTDSKAYVKPWTVTIPLSLRADTELIESFCEGQQKHDALRRIAPAPPERPSSPVK